MIWFKIPLQCRILHQSVRAYHTSQAINKLWYQTCFKQHKYITDPSTSYPTGSTNHKQKGPDFLISKRSLKSKYRIFTITIVMSHGGLFAFLEIDDLLLSLIEVFTNETKVGQRPHFPSGKAKDGINFQIPNASGNSNQKRAPIIFKEYIKSKRKHCYKLNDEGIRWHVVKLL